MLALPGERAEEVTLLREQNGSRQILLIDRDEVFCQVLQQVLGTGYSLRRVATAKAGASQLDTGETDVVLLNLDLQNGAASSEDVLALVRFTTEQESAPPVIVYGWDTRWKKALAGFRPGVVDCLDQPLDVQALKFRLDAACRRADLARDLGAAQRMLSSNRVPGLLGNSKPMARVNELIQKVSQVLTSVLITGESGTGKGVVARAIHDLGPRAKQPFVAFSACALPESLIEDELFGHEKGAFTGAIQSRRGRFEEARGGTIFLDEIGDLALPLQAKLLRVLQERSLERLGSNPSHRRPNPLRHQPQSGKDGAGRELSGRSVFPYFRRPHPHAGLAGENGRHPVARRVLPEDICANPQQTRSWFHFGFPAGIG